MPNDVDHAVDFEELCWLVGRYRRAGEARDYWLDQIRADYGPRMADIVRNLVILEAGPRQEIEYARQRLHTAYAETYLYVLQAYRYERGE